MKPLEGNQEAHTDGDVIIVLDLATDAALLARRSARELVNRIQKLRKKAGLQPHEPVEMWVAPAVTAAATPDSAPAAASAASQNGAAPVDAQADGGTDAAQAGNGAAGAVEAELWGVMDAERGFLDDALGGHAVLPAAKRPRGAVEIAAEETTLVLPSEAVVNVRVALTAPAASVCKFAVAEDYGAEMWEPIDVFVASKGLGALQQQASNGGLKVKLDGTAVTLHEGRHLFWRAADVP